MSRIGGVSVAIGVERRLNVNHLQGRSGTNQIICAPKRANWCWLEPKFPADLTFPGRRSGLSNL